MPKQGQEFAASPAPGAERVVDAMTDQAESIENDQKQKQAYQQYLEMDGQQAQELAKIDGVTGEEVHFDTISDGELEKIYESLLERPKQERSATEEALLSQTKERYIKIKFYRQFQDAQRWFASEYPERDFDEIVSSDSFLEFASGVKLPIRELIRRYVKLNTVTPKKPRGAGSVRSNGSTVAKDYFTPAEVDRMSEKEIEQNLEAIKKSMTKWN